MSDLAPCWHCACMVQLRPDRAPHDEAVCAKRTLATGFPLPRTWRHPWDSQCNHFKPLPLSALLKRSAFMEPTS